MCHNGERDSPYNYREKSAMPKVTLPAHQTGDFLVDYEEKVFEDVKAEPGQKALVTFHSAPKLSQAIRTTPIS